MQTVGGIHTDSPQVPCLRTGDVSSGQERGFRADAAVHNGLSANKWHVKHTKHVGARGNMLFLQEREHARALVHLFSEAAAAPAHDACLNDSAIFEGAALFSPNLGSGTADLVTALQFTPLANTPNTHPTPHVKEFPCKKAGPGKKRVEQATEGALKGATYDVFFVGSDKKKVEQLTQEAPKDAKEAVKRLF
eukprot:scaffold2686_cov22-Tisochrysis_lutea.AAC.1